MNAKDLLINNRYCSEHFNRDEYPMLFERVKEELVGFLASLEDSETAAKAAVDDILEEVCSNMDRHRFKFRKGSVLADDHFVLSLFIAPVLARIGTPKAVKFAELLASGWEERFPGSTFKIGDYDEIMEGFKWKITLPFT